MKLKKITLIALFIFVGFFAFLAFLKPNNTTDFHAAAVNTPTQNTNGEILDTQAGNSSVNTTPANGLTLAEVAKHSTSKDCYLIVNGAAYDVTSYIYKHPGGARNITSRCGTEATKVFSAIHSNFAWNLLKDFYVADIVSANSTNAASSTSTSSTSSVSTSTSTPKELSGIEQTLKKIYPNAEIVDVKPKHDYFVAKIIDKDVLYEVHIDSAGKVLKKEVENDEVDWSRWDEDEDDD